MEVLRGVGLVKRFGGVAALDGVDISVGKGEFLCIIGPNGSGKTTLINVLSGLIKPDAGRILLDGMDVTGQPPEERVKHGLARAFQLPQLFPDMTVLENALIAASQHAPTSLSGPDEGLAREVLELFDLWELRNRLVTELSEGHRKLLDIALTMMLRPKIVLLDEPTSSVSSAEKMRLMEKVVEILRGREVSALIVEHDLDVVERFADRVAVMSSGKIIAVVPPSEARNVKV